MDLKENAREHLLDEALKSIEDEGIYWNGLISRNQRGFLVTLLNENGHDIHMSEVPPNWEHVFYTSKYSDDDVLEIAKQRAIDSEL